MKIIYGILIIILAQSVVAGNLCNTSIEIFTKKQFYVDPDLKEVRIDWVNGYKRSMSGLNSSVDGVIPYDSDDMRTVVLLK